MNNAGRIVPLTVSGLVGVAVAAYVFGARLTPEAARPVGIGDGHLRAGPMCTGTSNVAKLTFYGEMSDINARMHDDMQIATSGNTDRDFALMMIPHHQGAIEMAQLQLKYGRDERLRRLAQSIIIEQGQEIAYMLTLLDRPIDTATVTDHVARQ